MAGRHGKGGSGGPKVVDWRLGSHAAPRPACAAEIMPCNERRHTSAPVQALTVCFTAAAGGDDGGVKGGAPDRRPYIASAITALFFFCIRII